MKRRKWKIYRNSLAENWQLWKELGKAFVQQWTYKWWWWWWYDNGVREIIDLWTTSKFNNFFSTFFSIIALNWIEIHLVLLEISCGQSWSHTEMYGETLKNLPNSFNPSLPHSPPFLKINWNLLVTFGQTERVNKYISVVCEFDKEFLPLPFLFILTLIRLAHIIFLFNL